MTLGQMVTACGWAMMVVGISMGSLIGMYAFAGPFRAPKGHEAYDALPRRLFRLAHIAAIMLPLISIIYGMHLDTVALSASFKQLGAASMMTTTVGIPLFLTLAMFNNRWKYLEVIPVTAFFIALILMALGQFRIAAFA